MSDGAGLILLIALVIVPACIGHECGKEVGKHTAQRKWIRNKERFCLEDRAAVIDRVVEVKRCWRVVEVSPSAPPPPKGGDSDE